MPEGTGIRKEKLTERCRQSMEFPLGIAVNPAFPRGVNLRLKELSCNVWSRPAKAVRI
jgi:hypothetical protein